MSLYIGKNYDSNSPVQSIFRLTGDDENALTYALGYLLAHDKSFCEKLIQQLNLFRSLQLSEDYSIHLQEVAEPRFGIPDIVIHDDGTKTRIVIEAKIRSAVPDKEQIGKYASNAKAWSEIKNRAVVALTRNEISQDKKLEIKSVLPDGKNSIRFRDYRWHDIIVMAMGHTPYNDSEASKFLFQQFNHFITRDYEMGFYDAEIHIQDIDEKNEQIFEEGWMYVTIPSDKKAPLYFAPYFTRARSEGKSRMNPEGISKISRVVFTLDVAVKDLPQTISPTALPPAEEQRRKWTPQARERWIKEHGCRWDIGLEAICGRAKNESFDRKHSDARLLFLDRPIEFTKRPVTKKVFNSNNSEKQMPNQIPKGFSLGFDQLVLRHLNVETF